MADTNVAVEPAATSWGAVLGGWVATIGASVIFAPLVAGLLAAMGGATQNGSDLAVAVPVVVGLLVSYVVGGYVAGRMAGYRTSWHGLMTAFFSLLILLLALLVGAAADRGMFAGSGVGSISDIVPGARDLNINSLGNAVSFGAILGFLAAIFGGWLGGLLAPTQRAVVGAAPLRATPATTRDRVLGGRVVRDREVVRDRGTVGEPVRSEREREVVREPIRGDRERDVVRDREVVREPVRSEREVVRERPGRMGGMLPSFGRKGGERVAETDTERAVADDRAVEREREIDRERPVDEVHTAPLDRPEDT